MVLNSQWPEEIKEDWPDKCEGIEILELVRKGEADSGEEHEREES